MTDPTARLAEALDRAEHAARAYSTDAPPATVLRLVDRDRRTLADLDEAKRTWLDTGDAYHQGRYLELGVAVDRAAAFWLPEVPDA